MEQKNINQKIDKQTAILEQIAKQTKTTHKYIIWLKVLSIIKLLIILAPIILAVIYLPGFIRKAIDKYNDILPGLEEIQEAIENNPRNNPPIDN